MLVFDLKLKISQPLPPIQKQINTERKKPLSSQHIGPPQLKNEGGCKSSEEPVWTTDSKKNYLSWWRGLRTLQRSSDSTESLGSHGPFSLSQNNTSQAPPFLQLKSCGSRRTVTNTAFKYESACFIKKKKKRKRKRNTLIHSKARSLVSVFIVFGCLRWKIGFSHRYLL